MATWSYYVKQRYVNSTNTVVSIDISKYVVTIENMTDTGSGEINSATLVLNANKGQFITQENLVSNVPTTPILAEFDRIEMRITDKYGDSYRNVYEVRTLEIKKSIGEGTRLIVRLVGLERALSDVQFSKPFYYENAWTVVRDIIDQYHDNKGTKQPTVVKYDKVQQSGTYYNNLPNWTYGNFDFGQQATACYEGIDEVVNSLGTSVSGGGAGDFFETRFPFNLTSDYNQILFEAFASGSQPELDGGTISTLESSVITPHYYSTGNIESRNGTLICGKGAMGFGSLPVECMKWWGEFEAYLNGIPEWKAEDENGDDIYYKKDSLVSHYSSSGGPSDPTIKWRALRDNNDVEPTTTNSSDWEQIQIGDLITNTNYSIWTNNGSTDGYKMWKAGLANPNAQDSGEFDELCVFDGNMYSADKGGSGGIQMQEYVDYYGGSTNHSSAGTFGNIPQNLLYNTSGSIYKPYRGFKMLVDSDTTISGNLEGSFAQNGGRDRHGSKYDKAVVKYRGLIETDGTKDYMNWDVVFPKKASGTDIFPTDGSLCAVIYDADNRIFDNSYTNSGTVQHIWRSYWKSETKRGVTVVPYKDVSPPLGIEFFGGQNHCFHKPQEITQAAGINTEYTRTGSSTSTSGNTYGTNSAIVFKYAFSSLGASPVSVDYRNSEGYYTHGAWAAIRFPFPTSNNFSQTIGSKFGNNTTKLEPVTVDINNMHLTPSGKVGFNNTESENLGQIDAIEGFVKLQIKNNTDTKLRNFVKNFKIRVTCYDTSNNVAVQDFVIPFNDAWYHMRLPIKSFKVYRARRYWGGQDDIGAELFPPELEILEIFQWKNLKMITWQTQDSYDDQGRYKPDVSNNPFSTAGIARFFIDNFHFSKQLIATSGVVTDRNITPQWLLRPFTTNYYQLKKDVLSQLEIDGFQHQGYNITTEGRCDPNLKFGYSFYLKDDKIVKRADKNETAAGDNDGVANTIKLVAKRIVYNLTGTTGGQGGFTRTITGVKRFESGD